MLLFSSCSTIIPILIPFQDIPTPTGSSTDQEVTKDNTDIWIDGTLGGTVPTLLGDKILEITENASQTSGQEYTQITNTGNKLSPAGGTIAMKAIEGVRSIVPAIFAFTSDITEEPDSDTESSDTTNFFLLLF